ncbi:MAG: YbgA family protein [Kiritimatiellia bacterium]
MRRCADGRRCLRLGISSCLLGRCVRYDGQHKLDAFLVNRLGRFVEYVPLCPEVECGFGVPREPMHLVGHPNAPRLVTQNTGTDVTNRMLAWAECRVCELEGENLCGFIFKSKSPSCGIAHVKLYDQKGVLMGSSRGIFASVFIRHFPHLPVEEESRLHDPELCSNFIERARTLRHFRDAVSRGPAGLVFFHRSHKLLLMSHSAGLTRELGRIVAKAGKEDFPKIRAEYEDLLAKTLVPRTTAAKQVNVLQHILGFFKKLASREERRAILDAIARYRSGDLALPALLLLFRRLAQRHKVDWLLQQVYLDPERAELSIGSCLSSPTSADPSFCVE